jgi:Kef-type K+ transport system membrane component KefB
MRVVGVIFLVAAVVVGALALSIAIATGREYGIQDFWLALAWGGLFTLVLFVPGVLLLRPSKKHGRDVTRHVKGAT